jgi:PAS domain S-box-containing protein
VGGPLTDPSQKARSDDESDRLRISEAHLRRAQAVAGVGSWEIDLARKTMWGSDEAFRIYGLERTPDNMLPLALAQDIPTAEHRPRLDRALTDLLAGRADYDIAFEIRRASDGAARHVRSLAALLRNTAGEPVAVIGTLQDVTREKENALALEAALARARMLFEQAADAILLGDGRGKITTVNERAVELTGYTREEIAGKSIDVLFSEETRARQPWRFDLLEHGEAVVRERVLTRKDGALVPIEMRTRKLPDGTYQSILRDLTDRKRLEAQLQLRQRMDSIGTLASGIAHDFNNILAAIIGYADMLKIDRSLLTDDQNRSVENILQAAGRAADLVRGLRALTKPTPSHLAAFDLHEPAAEVFRVLNETTNRLVAKELAVAKDTSFVLGSESDIYHVLMNLGVNAVQAIEEKGASEGDRVRMVASEFRADAGDRLGLAPGSYVHVRFSDTGAGMSEEVRRRAFDPLFSTKEKGPRKGQGLGLTMVYTIVVGQHGGHIEIESEQGRGTTFHLYLPQAVSTDVAPQRAVPGVLTRGTETVLVVDDEPQILSLAKRTLERAGYTVISAPDGQAAIEAFGRDPASIAVVLLDRTLPRLSGAMVFKEMRRVRPDVKIIVSSGDGLAEGDEFPGAHCILAKPYTTRQLCSVVRDVLDGA